MVHILRHCCYIMLGERGGKSYIEKSGGVVIIPVDRYSRVLVDIQTI